MIHTIAFSSPSQINGDQLIAEILASTGVNVADAYGFATPSTVVIAASIVGDKQAAIQAVIDAHAPAPKPPRTKFPRRQFVNERITPEEQDAIEMSEIIHVRRLWRQFMLADEADLESQELIDGFNALEHVFGILGEGRAAQILDPTWPGLEA